MSFSLSPQLRMIAMFGAAAVVLALGAMFFVMRGMLMSEDVAEVPMVVHHPRPKTHKATPAPAHKPKAATPAKHKPTATPKTHAATPTPKTATPKTTTPNTTAPKTTPGTIRTPGVAPNGLPMVIAKALHKERVVVVALVVPGGELDEITVAEAKAGAEAAGVGFLSVNVLKNSIGRPLAQKLGVIQTPSLVVYRRPATVFVRFDGFADRDTVRQAATSARAGR